ASRITRVRSLHGCVPGRDRVPTRLAKHVNRYAGKRYRTRLANGMARFAGELPEGRQRMLGIEPALAGRERAGIGRGAHPRRRANLPLRLKVSDLARAGEE